ncbi:hypothetical protein [Methylosinus sp. PW1]|uniref:hypothetical protein n=1 Tax=Methylosinus sp. PW1 TaxID=107636 RepID=UPI00056AA1F5|nr:hypothetical protein [Methylosinus sp. PW1]
MPYLIEERYGNARVIRSFAFATRSDADAFIESAILYLDSMRGLPGAAEIRAKSSFRVLDAALHPEIKHFLMTVDMAFESWCGAWRTDAVRKTTLLFPPSIEAIIRRIPEVLRGRRIDLDVGPVAYIIDGKPDNYGVSIAVGHIYDHDSVKHYSRPKDGSPLLEVVTPHNVFMVGTPDLTPASQWIQDGLMTRCIRSHLMPLKGRRGGYEKIEKSQLQRVV